MSLPTTNSAATVAPGTGGLPKLTLIAPDGARAEVYLYGAHVASWVPAGGVERMFLSRKSAFQRGAPVRGGIPIAFPQFGMDGPLPLHGLVRLMMWELVSAGADPAVAAGQGAVARLRVTDTAESRARWDHAFEAALVVEIGGNKLSVTLEVRNTGAAAFDFTTALHTYLAVDAVSETTVEGLAGLRYRDNAAGGVEVQDDAPVVSFRGEVTRIYFAAPAEAHVAEAGRTTTIQQCGFPDVVVWNPGAVKCATVPDLEPEDYRRFVCVEAAAVRTPIHLPPGEQWQGRQAVLA